MPTLPEPTAGDAEWSIHWGIYSVAARHEWVKNRERISDEDSQGPEHE